MTFAALVSLLLVSLFASCRQEKSSAPPATKKPLETVRFGVSPFQDTLLPIIGKERGWYAEEGLDVQFTQLGWTEVMEALSAGQVDVAINNETSVVATHTRNPNIVYYYGLNPFDNGFALMIRPNSKLKPLSEVLKTVPDRAEAVRRTAAQLKGKTVITTSKTDMEQGVAAAALRGGLDFRKDVRIIDLNPDEGLAAFLHGDGDAFIGGIPQRTRAAKEGMIEMLTGADLGPPPINGLVTTKQYAAQHEATLLALLHVWFRTVKSMNAHMEQDAPIIISALNRASGAQFTLEDFKRFWNNYEHFPSSPREVELSMLHPSSPNYWRARWDDCNRYFVEVTHTLEKPVDPADACMIDKTHAQYVKKYGAE
ncbi:MAG: ABC transporter substrate-binding protein [Acidobacteriota bacterium]|nr:ABC transporter substrate-binding protein [Acidobacteriota bacterium]